MDHFFSFSNCSSNGVKHELGSDITTTSMPGYNYA